LLLFTRDLLHEKQGIFFQKHEMIQKTSQYIFSTTIMYMLLLSCSSKLTPIQYSESPKSDSKSTEPWVIDSQEEWQNNIVDPTNVKFVDGQAIPTSRKASFRSSFKQFSSKKAVKSISFFQVDDWLNWETVDRVGPANLGDAPVALQLGDDNYWMFGRYNQSESQKDGTFQNEDAVLSGYTVNLKTTPFKNQYDAPGGLMPGKGGYHAWQSKDMINWVHHGPISETFSRWMTSAEYADGKYYFYYDYPNDQDPHLYIDEDLTDGVPGKNMGMAFHDPTHGSDCAIIRDLDGNFHLILEDWTPINAATHAWDSPLAVHAVSADGIGGFKMLDPPVDERTTPTGEIAEYVHPHWHMEVPERFPGRTATEDMPQYNMKAGQTKSFAKYQVHKPEQNAYGDWASISIGEQYYLFADFDPAGGHGRKDMSVAWFTSDNINKPFSFCGNIGQGHPDPDIMFAEGKFYLVTQLETDFISPGPWVETVEVRLGVDTNNNGQVNQWSSWQEVAEKYGHIEGFAKQIKRTPAQLDLSELPEGYGFQFEVRLNDRTFNDSKPILDKVEVLFGK
jgi:hypothetical protein